MPSQRVGDCLAIGRGQGHGGRYERGDRDERQLEPCHHREQPRERSEGGGRNPQEAADHPDRFKAQQVAQCQRGRASKTAIGRRFLLCGEFTWDVTGSRVQWGK